jgi:hypothetical protein
VLIVYTGAVGLSDWLLADLRLPKSMRNEPEAKHPWWRVMCLTGVDYFSTLGYQPSIAFLAAGALSPLATLILILVTFLGALPVYSYVAGASPGGHGSIGMMERVFPQWSGKTFVLILLGFATTDFVITMTLSAADAAAHFLQNPFTPEWMKSQMAVTLLLLAALGGIFLKGFKEAIGVAVVLVGIYLALNLVVAVAGIREVVRTPMLLAKWKELLLARHSSPLGMVAVSLVLFPKLALGLSGFETGVTVMPLIRGRNARERVRNARKLLLTAASIMGIFLMSSSIITTLLIPAEKFQAGGEANGRALAYLAHHYLGNVFGSCYDVATATILAFAGASAMAGLLNLIPRYLPRFGMAPEWARASRPLVLVFVAVTFTVTILFHADVDAQGGAYATGVLVLITSAASAVTMAVWKTWYRWLFLAISLVFVYTTLLNIYERPEGIKISTFFIGAMVVTSVVSRAVRSTELRIRDVVLDDAARELLVEDKDQVIRIVARRPRIETEESFDKADRHIRAVHGLGPHEQIYFFEVEVGDASQFEHTLYVTGKRVGRHALLYTRSPVVANAIAAFLIHMEKTTERLPHGYFQWTEGNPIMNLIRFLLFGEGDVAPVTHEVLRRAVSDPAHRPVIHVS